MGCDSLALLIRTFSQTIGNNCCVGSPDGFYCREQYVTFPGHNEIGTWYDCWRSLCCPTKNHIKCSNFCPLNWWKYEPFFLLKFFNTINTPWQWTMWTLNRLQLVLTLWVKINKQWILWLLLFVDFHSILSHSIEQSGFQRCRWKKSPFARTEVGSYRCEKIG